MPAADLWPPEHLAWWVLAVGAGLLVLVVAWYILVFALTRPRRQPAPSAGVGSGERARFEAQVGDIYRRYEAHELDLRGLHLELARTMREYASLRLGRDVSSWTASELTTAQPGLPLGELLREWEEPSFARRSDAEARRAVSGAREVITRW